MSPDVTRAGCALVDTWLDDWLAGRLPEGIARRLDEHVDACDRCRRLVAIASGGEVQSNEAGEDADLLPAVLGRTTGSPCARAEQLLPALVDDQLDANSREILQAHVAHCDGCSQVLAALQEAEQVLPALAHTAPPPGFAEAVLRATSAAPRRAALAEWWLRILARPRASLELAYVGTVLLVVLLGNPVAAFHEARVRAGELAGSVPVARLAEQLPASDAAMGTLGRLFAPVRWAVDAIATEISERWRQARTLLDAIESAIGSAIRWLSTVDVKQSIRAAEQALQPRGQPPAEGQRKH
jgi:anti-sigma factor RsiW